jgi:hypothetical protein
MYSDYLNILQLRHPAEGTELEQAYKYSCLRLLRLTSRGPLQYYRSDLLSEALRAYQGLKQPTPQLDHRPMSLLARRVANQPRSSNNHTNTYSQPGRSRTWQKAQIEDNFCREVIYRLEGDIIRFDSRKELLALAKKWNIGLFQANMLIAQIVESVRQNKLYQPSIQERNFLKANKITKHAKKSSRRLGLIIIIAVILAGLADLLLIKTLAN